MSKINVIENEDNELDELLNKTAQDLQKKYNKQRQINEKYLKKKTPAKKVLSIFLDAICVIILFAAFTVCFSIINTTINGYMPNFAGYSNLVVSSKSMVASGFNVGDIFIVHSVDAKTLNVDDKIAFYNYPPSYINMSTENLKDVSNQVNKTKYSLTIQQLYGFQTEETKLAKDAKSDIVFHHIRAIYEDENGERWFKTYGSSNSVDDSWWINENYIVGIQDESGLAKTVIGLVNFVGKPYGMLVLVVPISILVVTLLLSFLKSIQIAKLEMDCVEEKRKITDPICIRNKVGYQMNDKTKLKILAQATDENKEEYIKLLWKNETAPINVKKYYMRRKLNLNIYKDLLALNRECENMFKDGKNPTQIAKYYRTEKAKIETRKENIRKRLKSIDKASKKNNNKKDIR